MRMPLVLSSPRAYQATDLARHHREVVDDAREGIALIRDKDGTALVMTTAARLERLQEVGNAALALVQLARALEEPGDRRRPSAYGDLAWVSVLPDDAQRRFLDEVGDRLLITATGGKVGDLAELLGDWLATAQAWADPETRDALLADEPTPPANVEL